MEQDKKRIVEIELVVSVGIRPLADMVVGRLPEAQPVAFIGYALSRTELEESPLPIMVKFMADRMFDGMVGGLPQLRDKVRKAIEEAALSVITDEMKLLRSSDALIDGIKFAEKPESGK